MRRALAVLTGLALLSAASAEAAGAAERSSTRSGQATCLKKKQKKQKKKSTRGRSGAGRARKSRSRTNRSRRPAARCSRGKAAAPGRDVRAPGTAAPGRVPAPAAAPAIGAVPAAPVSGPAEGSAPAPAPVASTIGVNAYDLGTFVLRLTRTSVPAGNLTIYFRNHDVSEHNLWLAAPSGSAPDLRISDDVGEGGGATRTVAVTRGTWRLYCSLPGHGTMTRDLPVG